MKFSISFYGNTYVDGERLPMYRWVPVGAGQVDPRTSDVRQIQPSASQPVEAVVGGIKVQLKWDNVAQAWRPESEREKHTRQSAHQEAI